MYVDQQSTKDFYAIGLSYKKADTTTRGRFSLNTEQYACLLKHAPQLGVEEVFVVSTCNRTEIYGFAYCQHQLIHLLCHYSAGSSKTLSEKGYTYKNEEAIAHLFRVAGGLDSQILGDYEIVGQIKRSVDLAREHGRLGAYTERLISMALSSSKDIKNQTLLSSGTVSVSYATVQYLEEKIPDLHQRRILLVGAGKIGASTCKNLLSYTQVEDLTILNRTAAKAKKLAVELGVKWAPAEEFKMQVANSEVIILATSSPKPILSKEHLLGVGAKTIIDLSIPRNVKEEVPNLPNITFIDVDELSRVKDITLQQRMVEVPKAEKIIRRRMAEFHTWKEKRKHAPFLKAVKKTLENISTTPFLQIHPTDEKTPDIGLEIHHIVRHYARKVGKDQRYGCHFIEAIKMYLNSESILGIK